MGPGDVLAHLVAWLIAPVAAFFSPGDKVFVLYSVGSVLLAMLVFLRAGQRRPLRAFFSREVWGHPSAKVDLRWYFVNGSLAAALLLPLLALQSSNAHWVAATLGERFGTREGVAAPGIAMGIGMAFVATLVNDLAVYLPHWLQHRVPVLWQFHKVHHSAEVLTPLTAYRFHPVDDLLNVVCISGIVGTFDGLLLWLYPFELVQLTLLGTNGVLFLFYLLGVHLRHSHVWLPYPPLVSRVLISPAMHQVHHSTNPEHFNKNLGLVFSFWDWLFGTLYVPERKLDLVYGLGDGEEKEFSSVRRLYTLPFAKAAALVRPALTRLAVRR